MEEQRIQFDEINPVNVAKDLLRNFWVVILLVLSVNMAVSAFGKMNHKPQYISEATLVVSAKGNPSAYSSLNLTSSMAGVFSEVFRSNILLEKVENKLGEKLDGYVNTRTVPKTNLMMVSVVSSSPEQAFRALRLFLDTYPEISDVMMANAVLDVIREPGVPMAPMNGSTVGSSRKVTLVALVLSVGLVAVLSILRDTVQTPAAAKRKVDGRLLRSIRHERRNKTLNAMRKKKNPAPLITNPLVSTGFREDNQNLCSKLEYHMRKREQKVVLVSSAGENEGKSTVAANLALGLAAHGGKVALLDCDFRKPAVHKIFQVKAGENQSFSHYLAHEDAPEDFLLYLKKPNLYVGINRGGSKHPQRLFTSGKMEALLKKLSQEMDYIVLDTPPMTVAADTEALAGFADVTMLVVREDGMMVREINDSLDSLYRSSKDVAGFVLNNCMELSYLKR